MENKLSFDFNSLNINKENIEIAMGYEAGKSPAPIPDLINEVYQQAPDYCDIQAAYKKIDKVKLIPEEKKLHINGKTFAIGKTLTNQLLSIEAVILFVATAGEGIEKWSKQEMASGDMMKGYIIDVLGSEIADEASIGLYEKIIPQFQKKNLKLSSRYSPGYCEWSINEQKKLFSFFSPAVCGVTLTESSLMHPIKSISGIIGVGKNMKRLQHTCHFCPNTQCIYRYKRHLSGK